MHDRERDTANLGRGFQCREVSAPDVHERYTLLRDLSEPLAAVLRSQLTERKEAA